MTIAIGSDSAGYTLKMGLIPRLEEMGHTVIDEGCFSTEPADYPDYAERVASRIKNGETERGILICGTGQGMTISANKIPGIRASLCFDTLPAFLSREHNDANVLCMGSWQIDVEKAVKVAEVWLFARFAGGPHQRRVEKIAELESKR